MAARAGKANKRARARPRARGSPFSPTRGEMCENRLPRKKEALAAIYAEFAPASGIPYFYGAGSMRRSLVSVSRVCRPLREGNLNI